MNPALPHLCKESSTGETIYYTWFTAMHTRVDLLFAANEAESFFSDISLKTFHEIASIEKLANAFDSESELSFVNSHATGKPWDYLTSPQIQNPTMTTAFIVLS